MMVGIKPDFGAGDFDVYIICVNLMTFIPRRSTGFCLNKISREAKMMHWYQ